VFRKTGGDRRWEDLSKVCVFPAAGAVLVAVSEGCAWGCSLAPVPALVQHLVIGDSRCNIY